ncbi:helix-turn-helix domain-containing protein [Devosia sp. XJ19-1]|uniref:Helix-turn-helix domain-containing protein n=1 Tax=Devosia ureilytica TaxID=2952754 RepID=A0A9Q4FSZ0_9HYPH|nr:IclR family transcriptional regulator C-terminal domain-containing protein [Devosia ureilytica]MCP8883772.1 helix-turn-helix domain-containing protein [Devosia ureilytica]MCP8887380.1 helix-turn-helix domain-containing protein [Devosia ureilytica]
MRDGDIIHGLMRGLAVIECFDEEHARMSITDVAQRTGLERATARRCLLTLAHLGYASYDGKFFQLTPRVLNLGHSYLAATPLPRLIQPFLEELAHATSESTSAAVLEGPDILYVARASTRRVMSINLGAGARLPAYCTSMGRTLLAALPADEAQTILDRSEIVAYTERTKADMATITTELAVVAAQGFAVIDQELELGLCSIAVPLYNAAGQVVAAINIGAQTARAPTSRMIAHFLPLMRKVQAEVRPLLR